MSKQVTIICPPIADYPIAPQDQGGCEEFICPKCKEKMWLSKNKKSKLLFIALIHQDILFACYNCFIEE